METSISGANHAVFRAQATGVVWDRQRLLILVLITLFCTHKATGVVWDRQRLLILVLITLFCMHKTTGDVWDP